MQKGNVRYTSHKKAYFDGKGYSPRDVQELTVITDISKRSHEVALKNQNSGSYVVSSFKNQKVLRTNSSC